MSTGRKPLATDEIAPNGVLFYTEHNGDPPVRVAIAGNSCKRRNTRLKPSRRKERAAEPIDPLPVAGEAVRVWDLVQSRLAPIIGEDGFRLLFARSLHRARVDHAWLALGSAKDGAFSSLKKSLEAQTPESASRGNLALTSHFNELLHALIGEELATRLIGRLTAAGG